MLHKTRAIVLHSLKYGESSLIVHCYTEEWGRQSFLLKGIRKSRKNNKANMFHPLVLLSLDVYFKEGRDLQWIKEAAYYKGIPSFSRDITRSAQAMFLAEVMMKVLREEEKNEALFHFLMHSLEYFEMQEKASPSFHLLFLFSLSRYLGFFPRNNYDENKVFFNRAKGSFSALPGGGEFMEEKALGVYWKNCFNKDYSTIDQVFINQSERNLFLTSILEFYSIHQETFKDLRSFEVLKTLFA